MSPRVMNVGEVGVPVFGTASLEFITSYYFVFCAAVLHSVCHVNKA